jgi:hypothetical protein
MLNTFSTYAQQDSSRVEQYCEVIASEVVFSKKVAIDIDYGEGRSTWKDNRLRAENGKLKKFNSLIDALNYLGKDGWKLVNAFPFSPGTGPAVYHYVLKKEFPKFETE